jgi:hypothetical protein
VTRRTKAFSIERDFYDQSYLISQNARDMQIVNIAALLGTVQLRDFLNQKATAIRMLLRHKYGLMPVSGRVCTVCSNSCENHYALCCERLYCSDRCQNEDWTQHKLSCKKS